MTTRNQVLQTAASYIGYTERRTKAHPEGNVTIFWDALDPDFQGSPWCAAFVNYVLRKNGIDTLLKAVPLPYFTPSMESWAKKNGRWIASKDGKPGDVLIFTERATVHTGFLEAQRGGAVQTIEGNTSPGNSGSQANGGGVYRRLRSRSFVRGCISLDGLYSGVPTLASGIPAPLDVDGAFGPASVRAWQWYLKVKPVDGEMGPITIKALQGWVGVAQTGTLTRKDIRAIQRKVGATPDGAWGPMTTIGLQKFVNRRIADAVAKGQK